MNASQLPQSTPAFKRKIRFGTIDVGSGSESDSDSIDNLEAPPTHQQDTPDYYDPIYFDSDEEDEPDADETMNEQGHGNDDNQDDDEKEYDTRAGLTSGLGNSAAAAAAGSSSSQMADIINKLENNSMGETTKPMKKSNKKHATISDADLLYDPDEDDRDENWLIKKISANRPSGCRPEDIWTDAILSCPMCLTQLCFDCQQHEVYTHQFRAMFVEHCRVVETERLRFSNVPMKANNNNRSKKVNKSESSLSTSSQGSTVVENEAQQFKPSVDDDQDAVYNPVVCEICNTKVALMDQDEVFHFFNIIPTAV
ncbi:hypothetical protein BGZ47_007423 [Haplosporangium gracile]|nr:hypothetical protein BGZ47_007423 [Haplosporangium gracile]